MSGRYRHVVEGHAAQLAQRPALRALYKHYALRIRTHLSKQEGVHVELGSGSQALSEHLPELMRTDVDAHPGIDEIVNACAMPFPEGSCANLVAVDMLHHLPEPGSFFDEVQRVLTPGGRCILLEPHISAGSYPLYKFVHPEPLDLRADPFSPVTLQEPSGGPCNEAIATLAFGRHQRRFLNRWPLLDVHQPEFSDLMVYVLTGGYSYPSLMPASWVQHLMKLEDRLLKYTGRWVGLRILVVLEKRPSPRKVR